MRNEDSATPQEIENLRERHKALEKQKITAEANLNTSQQALDKLKEEAREKYGIDDLALLRAKLAKMTEENKDKRAEYQKHMTAIENQLAEVEAQYTEAANKE